MHNRRHQKKKTTGKCSIQQAQIYTRRPEDFSQNQDQNTRCLCQKHISIQQQAVDCDTRPGRPDSCPTEKFPQKNTRYQVAREDQQHKATHEDTGSQIESRHPKTKTEMVWSHATSR